MNDLSQTLEVGTVLIIEVGEYSDRRWSGPVRVIKPFIKADAADKFVKQHERRRRYWKPEYEGDEYDKPDPDAFLPWLVKTGYVEHVDNVTSWHVGSYGDFDP